MIACVAVTVLRLRSAGLCRWGPNADSTFVLPKISTSVNRIELSTQLDLNAPDLDPLLMKSRPVPEHQDNALMSPARCGKRVTKSGIITTRLAFTGIQYQADSTLKLRCPRFGFLKDQSHFTFSFLRSRTTPSSYQA